MSLGFWQLERLAWKEALLSRIEANMQGPPQALSKDLADPGLEYSRVCTRGEFLHDQELYLFSANKKGQGGFHIYTPLVLKSGGKIIVNRGWVPNDLKDPAKRRQGQLKGAREVCGLLRASREKGLFSPENNIRENRWFTPQLSEMEKALGIKSLVPFFLEADGRPNPGGYPLGGQTIVDIPNNHLGYAVTWFGLAAALMGVFGFFVYSQLRKP